MVFCTTERVQTNGLSYPSEGICIRAEALRNMEDRFRSRVGFIAAADACRARKMLGCVAIGHQFVRSMLHQNQNHFPLLLLVQSILGRSGSPGGFLLAAANGQQGLSASKECHMAGRGGIRHGPYTGRSEIARETAGVPGSPVRVSVMRGARLARCRVETTRRPAGQPHTSQAMKAAVRSNARSGRQRIRRFSPL